jgi:hypothetical protein
MVWGERDDSDKGAVGILKSEGISSPSNLKLRQFKQVSIACQEIYSRVRKAQHQKKSP